MKNKTFKHFIIIIILFICLVVVYKLPRLLINKNEKLPEVKLVKLKEIKDTRAFAIMVQNDDGYEEYKSEDDIWPGSKYIFKEAKCIDNSGALVDDAVTFADGKATLTTNQTIYCTLYFDEKPKTTIDILREKDKEVSDGIEHLSTDEQGGMYRYQGTDNVPNWICFGTRDSSECTDEIDSDGNSIPDGIDKYMYRIIGITKEGQMYLLKETFLKEENGTSFSWNDKWNTTGTNVFTCYNKICPEWNTSLLFKRINGTSNGTTKGKGNTSDNANTDIFVDSSEYDYLKSGDSINGTNDNEGSEWYQLIVDHEWMYGDTVEYGTENTYNGDYMYQIETGQTGTTHYVGTDGNNAEQTYTWNKETDKVTAKISLMYMHDVAYAYYDGSQDSTRGNPGNNTNVKNSWIHFQKDGINTIPTYEYLSTRYGVRSENETYTSARYVESSGLLFGNALYYDRGVRPVFYLSTTLKIASGDGTKDSPFILA